MEIAGISVRIERKKVKYLRIRIVPPEGEVRVSVPWHCSKNTVLEFLTEKKEWIISTRQKILQTQKLGDIFGKKQALVWLWGKLYIFTPTPASKRESIELSYEKLQRQILVDKLEWLVPFWESRLDVKTQVVKIRKMKTRWGSCNHRDGRIWINLELVRYPLPALEMVVVHELIHLRYAHHGGEFYHLLEQHLPDWKIRQKLLEQYFTYQR